MTKTTAMARERLGLVLGLLGLASTAWGASAGSTPASFNVSNSGAASYRIPIQVPPGVAGMQPQLVLQYDSQGGRGIAGPGWSLEGVPAIRRCPRTQMQDGVRGAVRLDANDRFCFNGQRLVMKSGQAGSYGADGLTYFTEVDSFARFRSFGVSGTGPTYFTVEEKGGRKLQFGNTADSRLKSIVAGGATPSDTVLTWYVNKVEDRSGNAVNYTYKNSNGEILLDTVSYANGKVQVKLEYVEDWNPRTMYLAGTKIQYTQLLSRITTTLVGGGKDGADLQAKQYRLDYDFSDMKGSTKAERPVGRLKAVQECASGDAGASCLPSQVFGWDYWTAADGKFQEPVKIGNPADKVLTFSLDNGFEEEGGSYFRGLADLNGDGRQDVVVFWKGAVYAYLSNLDGSYPRQPEIVSTDFASDGGEGGWSDYPSRSPTARGIIHRSLLDIDGDGYPDIVGFRNMQLFNGGPMPGGWLAKWNVSVGKFGNGFQVSDKNVIAGDGYYCGSSILVNDFGAPRHFADIDGDGYLDAVRFVNDGVYVSGWNALIARFGRPFKVSDDFRMTSAGGWYQSDDCRVSVGLVDQPVFFHDMNGDGYPDIVGVGRYDVWVAMWDPAIGKFAKAFSAGGGILSNTSDSEGNGRSNIRMGDMNGDGYLDLIDFGGDGVWVALWNGEKFENKTKWSNGSDFVGGNWQDGQQWSPMNVADMNGDGIADVVGFDTEGVHVALSNGRDGLAKKTLWTQNFRTCSNAKNRDPDPAGNPWIEGSKTPRFLQDVNGDGVPDLVGFGTKAMFWAPSSRSPATRISSIQDGLGARIDIGYDLAQPFASTVYSKPSTSSVHPRKDAHGPIYVVKSVRRSDGLAGLRSWTYQYGERRADFYRGQLGFAWMSTTDEGTGIVTKTSFSQDYPFVGQVLSETSTKAGLTLRQVSTVPQQEVLEAAGEYAGNKRVFVYSQTNAERRWDLSGNSLGTKTTTQEYSKTGGKQWGDLTAVTVETSDAGKVRTETIYKPVDEAAWLLGLPEKTTVTSQRPARDINVSPRDDAPPRTDAPLISDASLSPALVASGEAAQLCWTAVNVVNTVVSCSDNYPYAYDGSSAGRVCSPANILTRGSGAGSCTITGKNARGQTSAATVSFEVAPVATVSGLAFSNATPTVGSVVSLSWTAGAGVVRASVSCSGPGYASGASTNVQGTRLDITTSATVGSGSCTVTPYNALGRAGTAATASFTTQPPSTAPSITAAAFTPATVRSGQPAQLCWTAANVTNTTVSCSSQYAYSYNGNATGQVCSPADSRTSGSGAGTCTITGRNALGATSTLTATVNVLPAPTCSLTATPTSASTGQAVTYAVSGQNLPSGAVAYWFGTKNGVVDKSNEYAGAVPLSVSYTTESAWAGRYTRYMEIRDPANGQLACTTNTVTVDLTADPTITDARFTPASVTSGQVAQLCWKGSYVTNTTVSCGSQYPYSYNGAGTGDLCSPADTRTNGSGTVNCTITGKNAAGKTSTLIASLTVAPPPTIADASFSNPTPQPSSVTTLRWVLGSGATRVTVACSGVGYASGAIANPSGTTLDITTSATPGAASCTVTPFNALGVAGNAVAVNYTSAYPPSVTNARFTPASVTSGQTAQLCWKATNVTNTTVSCGSQYPYAYNGSATGDVCGPADTRTTGSGTATCTITGRNAVGQTSTTSVSINVQPAPTCSLSVSPSVAVAGQTVTYTVSGQNLPSGAAAYWYGTKNGTTDVSNAYAGVVPNSFSFVTEAAWAGKYTRYFEVRNPANGQLACTTNIVNVELR